MECPVVSFQMGLFVLCDFGQPVYLHSGLFFPALLEILNGMSWSGTYWLLGGGWFQCRYGGFWMISY